MIGENVSRYEDLRGRVRAASWARGLLLAVLCAALAATVSALAPSTAQAQTVTDSQVEVEEPLVDCSDVATQRGAQALFELEPGDRFALDEDGDGVACEVPRGQSAGVAAEDGTDLGAATGRDLDCMDFPSQAAAQSHLRSNPSDPYGLDVENNGVACADIGQPAPYEDPAKDVVPVAAARSKADLDCGDFEYQQEAQAVFFLDESDPNDLDRGQGGSAVCLGLPTLWANAHVIATQEADDPGGTESGAAPAAVLAQAPPSEAQGLLVLMLDAVALVLVASGALALLAVVWGRRGPSGSE